MEPNYHQSALPTEERATDHDRLWHTLGVWFRWRRFIVVTSLLAAIAAVIIALLLPVSYKATAAVIIPSQEQSGLASVLAGRSVSPLVSSFLGGSTGDYTRYLAILNSREMLDEVIASFDLESVYEVDTSDPRKGYQETLELLADNVEFEVDAELEFLSISVFDEDSVRAADMANFMVDELNRVNSRLTSENAGSYRDYVEKRYRMSQNRVDSLLTAQQEFQEKYGVIELPTQLESFYTALADYRMQVAQAEINAEVTRGQYGNESPVTKMAEDAYQSANRQYQGFLNGQDRLMSVAFNNLPAVGREYAELYKDLQLETEIIQVLAPLYEQSVLDEEKESIAVQVLDRAVPPVKKAWPPRTIIVIAVTLSVFLLCLIYALMHDWWKSNAREYAARLQSAARSDQV